MTINSIYPINLLIPIISIIFMLIITLLYVKIYINNNKINNDQTKLIENEHLKEIIKEQNLKLTEYKQKPVIDTVYTRDKQVENETLYPPIARTERPQYDMLINYLLKRPDFYVPTRGLPDTFRPLGYLTSSSSTSKNPDDIFVLYGREKYPKSDLGEFYITSTNKLSGLKVMLNNTNSNIKKIYDIPQQINITGNLLTGTYNYTELPKPDLTAPPYI